ncbi:MAG: ATPase [Bacteroidaceae bacterium]|nr:ATPase [Bacteroidaceae bacterium]MBR5149663.1 ATPase [Bacteroidaceae bacterium]
MILIADSGSTKTDWCLCDNSTIIQSIQTQGINPYHQTEEAIEQVLTEELFPQLVAQSSSLAAQGSSFSVIFYGSGCANETACNRVKEAIHKTLGTTDITIHSDLLGAARALCGHDEGIACVLGTGSNSCLYNGKEIIANVPPLGYILGDEGSSAVLGRRLVGDCLKNQLPEAIRNEFLSEYGLTQEIILEKVYRQPLANRFLASLTPFLSKHRDVPEIHHLLVDSFIDFFVRNVKQYRRPWLPIHFVGSIANAFSTELKEAAESLGMELGSILKSPMEGLVKFHCS